MVLFHDDIGAFEVCQDFEFDFDLILSVQQQASGGSGIVPDMLEK